MWYWHGMGFWGWTMMVAFWILVVLLMVWAVRPTSSSSPRVDAPLRILDERLARGEIDLEVYDERRAALLGGRR